MSIVDSIPSKNLPTSGSSATITTEREFLIHGIDRAWRGLTAANKRKSLDFMRALHLASTIDPEAAAAVMRSFHSSDMNDVNVAYEQLLKIAQSAIAEKLNKPAANDD